MEVPRCLVEAFLLSVSVELNHLIVPSRDNRESAEFLARLLALEVGEEWGPFIPVHVGNGVEVITQPYEPELARPARW